MAGDVLVLYTGGTIGSKPKDATDPSSPQVVASWAELEAATPELGNLGFRVDAISLPEPIDSCNVGPADWRFIAESIRDNYDDYEGFVVLHGTDTMAWTASALSFMFTNLAKPVVLTGAQRSAMVSRQNDATPNLLTALALANPTASDIPTIPEVVIYFGGKILRGNRTVKMNTVGLDAFDSPNLAPLGRAGDQITVDTNVLLPMPDPNARFAARTTVDPNVAVLLMYPGIQHTDFVQHVLETDDLKAVVVLSFGSGNIPTTNNFISVFQQAIDRGIVVANVAQCLRGPIEQRIYETGAALDRAGFVTATDITAEAAQCKLMVALADPALDNADLTAVQRRAFVERTFQEPQAGEQSKAVER